MKEQFAGFEGPRMYKLQSSLIPQSGEEWSCLGENRAAAKSHVLSRLLPQVSDRAADIALHDS
jgi:hypothetical protein